MTPEKIRAFAEAEVLPTLADRYENRRFSRDLWKKMAEAGLFGFLIPPQYGGSGRGPEDFVDAVEAFLEGGSDLGLCLSWIDHLLIHSHVISRFGSEDQRKRFLPALVHGDRIGALAASEPGTGANPVEMKSRAEETDGSFRIHGHKIFITNGPVADFIIVLARTGPETGKRGISAFVVDSASPGFRVRNEMDFGFLHTSPHGELLFEDCAVPAENLLGSLGDGHVRISRAVFAWERFLAMTALTAHFGLILDQILRVMTGGGKGPDGETRKPLAELHITLEGLRECVKGWACEVLGGTTLDARLTERLLFSADLLKGCRDQVRQLVEGVPWARAFPLGILLRDARLLDVGGHLYELQKDRALEGLLRRIGREENKERA